MALAVNGNGTVFNKCGTANYRPDSNQRCASSACQHTCADPDHCGHSWTLRYWAGGKQVEKSFRDKKRPGTKRVDYGSGKKLAEDWQLQPPKPEIPPSPWILGRLAARDLDHEAGA